MIRINQLKMPIHHTEEQLKKRILNVLNIKENELISFEIWKRSIDARKKPDVIYSYVVDVVLTDEKRILKKAKSANVTSIKRSSYQIAPVSHTFVQQPVIVGAGPAGLFCAYALVQAGILPIVIERGKTIEQRQTDVERFWSTGILNPASNVQFGEGGAGTFSDGKLNTLVKDPIGRNRFVLETFVKYGAPEHILYENKPHIGTDILADVIQNMRSDMERAGAKFLFETCMTGYLSEQNRIIKIQLNNSEWLSTDRIVLAIGHSARDTFRMLAEKRELHMEAKSFAVGFRVEHPQEMIGLSQYGEVYYRDLPAAPYKVTANLDNGRGVYSFCMCPGGYVVNASSEEGRLAVNGMSYSSRNGKNANSAIIVSITPDDFCGEDSLAGVRFQEQLEEKAYALGNGKIPQQLFGDYCADRCSAGYGAFESETKGQTAFCNLRGLLPSEVEQSFIQGMHHFSRMIPEYDRQDAILSAIESRTSSPVRICRDENFMADIKGIYPCGEGAGYAGGIMSAAMDGLKVAEAIRKEIAERD
jgi:hypothetical protein